MMPLIISGPLQLSNNIDGYFNHIEELKDLWMDGLETQDALKYETFVCLQLCYGL